MLLVTACTPMGEPAETREPSATASETSPIQPDWHVTASVDDDQVIVDGHGFPDRIVEIALCLAEARHDPSFELCDMAQAVKVTTDADGTFATTVSANPYIGVGARREVDCRDESCVVGVIDEGSTDMEVVGSQAEPLTWPLDAAAPVAPTLTLSGLSWGPAPGGGMVDVEGSGFVPHSEISLVQCPANEQGDGVDAGDCLYDDGTVVRADENGELEAHLVVHSLLQRSDGEFVECDGTAATECLIGDPWPTPGSGNRYVMVSLSEA